MNQEEHIARLDAQIAALTERLGRAELGLSMMTSLVLAQRGLPATSDDCIVFGRVVH